MALMGLPLQGVRQHSLQRLLRPLANILGKQGLLLIEWVKNGR